MIEGGRAAPTTRRTVAGMRPGLPAGLLRSQVAGNAGGAREYPSDGLFFVVGSISVAALQMLVVTLARVSPVVGVTAPRWSRPSCGSRPAGERRDPSAGLAIRKQVRQLGLGRESDLPAEGVVQGESPGGSAYPRTRGHPPGRRGGRRWQPRSP